MSYDKHPVLLLARSLSEIPSECDGKTVMVYIRSHEATFRVNRELVPKTPQPQPFEVQNLLNTESK
jgi:hypothetical protein